MAFRFRKSFKVAPGMRINLSKSGVSTSVGGKGITVNLSKRGTRVTTSLPGTGLSSSKLYRTQKAQGIQPQPGPLWAKVVMGIAALVFLLWVFN